MVLFSHEKNTNYGFLFFFQRPLCEKASFLREIALKNEKQKHICTSFFSLTSFVFMQNLVY